MAGLVGWMMIFGAGILVNSKPFRDKLAASFDWVVLLQTLATFTPTNVALLAVLSGFIGGCASLLLYGARTSAVMTSAESGKLSLDEDRMNFLTENPVGSAVRGFAVYLAFLAGTVLGANAPFDVTTQDQYIRMAGAVGIIAFAVGYDPTFFRQFISSLPGRKSKADQ
jgi:hypothetical protein